MFRFQVFARQKPVAIRFDADPHAILVADGREDDTRSGVSGSDCVDGRNQDCNDQSCPGKNQPPMFAGGRPARARQGRSQLRSRRKNRRLSEIFKQGRRTGHSGGWLSGSRRQRQKVSLFVTIQLKREDQGYGRRDHGATL